MRTKNAQQGPEVPVEVLRESGRSDVFWLLYDRYDQLEPRWRGRRVDWAAARDWVEQEGKRLTNGERPSRQVLRNTWNKVRSLKRREATDDAGSKAASAAGPVPRGKAADVPPLLARHSALAPPPRPVPGPAGASGGKLTGAERLLAITSKRSGR